MFDDLIGKTFKVDTEPIELPGKPDYKLLKELRKKRQLKERSIKARKFKSGLKDYSISAITKRLKGLK